MQHDIIDIFCYFSHKFITIPPISWINNCKQHGVKIIGTFITEWDTGSVNKHYLSLHIYLISYTKILHIILFINKSQVYNDCQKIEINNNHIM